MNLRSFVRGGVAAGLLAISLGMSGQALAQSASHLAAGRDFVIAKAGDQMFERIVLSTVDRTRDFFLQTNTAIAKDLGEVTAQLRVEFAAKRTEIAEIFGRSMAARFTEQELKDASAFYRSPLGQKLAQNEGAAFEEGMGRVRSWAEDFAEVVANRMRVEMKKRGHNL
ncbi:hypothetical protein GJW-30_1_03707 [Variibacter gotjawalensis]|uniref:DUF2059 domain-containing protein n=1 Tax=Variibacter gotjawalensis TaxID=1333996 RepID=A0A0S3PZ01_9BRAD|nr:DUF2059 domain-containing protein [Variibacter gotjawalensis]NIK46988.1 hypothetical protein [Variibacter gotjawalensis]RZS48892.1 hypothetical protein EV661_1314 [Variibacter gotjawalensis]BAT61151.1 hypothetical protein GJW-30_1_03707 [Variibacter gotjawalensis]